MVKTFTAQIEQFGVKVKEKADLVFKQSVQDVFEKAQAPKAQGGNLPVDTGNLRNSFGLSLNGAGLSGGADGCTAVIAGAEFGDVVFGGWTAAYAMRMEYGFTGEDSLGRTYNQAGNFFAGNAVAQWQQIVTANAMKVKDA